jgi:tryptophan synthase alpha chain|tara:strand:- start:1020 stop:1805 length:786 start_codon:yes stop_codon:yes gene_type:complete
LNRLRQKLKNLKEENKKALVAYLVAGDPDLDSTLNLMHLFVKSGVDVIEIGVPFTDPIAEGPVIQKAHDRALKNNISLPDIIKLVEQFREADNTTPVILMGYLNTFSFHKNIIDKSDENGVDAVLVVDIPGELSISSYGISNPNIDSISLISPTTSEDRIKKIAENGSGFIYYVTLRGVTGSSNLDVDEINTNIQKIRSYSDIPTLAGFGIKSNEDAKLLSEYSDGVIVGSSIVEMIHKESDSKQFDRIGAYLRELKEAIS